jgi:aminopeptidase N
MYSTNKRSLKNFFLTAVFTVLITSFIYSQPGPIFPSDDHYHPSRKFGMQKVEITTVENTYDVIHQFLDIEVDPAVQYIQGVVHTTFAHENMLEEIQMNMNHSLSIDSIIWEGRALEYQLEDPHMIRILFDSTLEPGLLRKISVYYQGAPEVSGFGSFIKSTHNSVPVLWTLSEPYGAKDWWPCKQGLEDKIDSLDVRVKVPSFNKVASNGLLAEVLEGDAHSWYHWKHRYPIATYLVAIAVTNYVEFTDTVQLSGGPLEILNYVYPEDFDRYYSETKAVIPIFHVLDSLIGPYPFSAEKYGHAQFSWPGGMEHQTMSFMGSFSFELIAHELSHQWFGDMVTCGSWQDIFLNEGFATYLTGICVENLLEEQWWDRWKSVRKDIVFEKPDGSIFVSDTTEVPVIFSGRLTYTKGAYLLHMLRWIMGDEPFFKVLRSYLNDPEVQYGFARIDNFISHAEQEYGESLDWFFNPWYYGEGHPIYEFDFVEKLGGIQGSVIQSGSAPQAPFFRLPLPFVLKFQDGDSTVVVWNEHPEEDFFISIPPERVLIDIAFDPTHWILGQVARLSSTKDQNSAAADIQIRPNPVSSEVLVLLTKRTDELKTYRLIDMNGRIVEQVITADNFVRWNLDRLPAGLYQLAVRSDTFKVVDKLVKVD